MADEPKDSRNPFDPKAWEERLRQLAQDTSEGEWLDPDLRRTEDSLIRDGGMGAGLWFRSIWRIIREVLERPTPKNWQRFMDATDDAPVDIKVIVDRIAHVIPIAERRAEHVDSLPPKGPPTKPLPTPPAPDEREFELEYHYHRLAKIPKMAEWIARQSAGAKMREWAEGMREDVRWQVAQAIREGISAAQLADRLNKRWDKYGQDFNMIAVTEMSMAYNNAMLAHLAGKFVVVPVIGDDKVCADCRRLLEGNVFYVSPTPIENPTEQQLWQYLWPGKSNVGRSREAWRPCVPLHPRCRHIVVKYRGGDPESYRARGTFE